MCHPITGEEVRMRFVVAPFVVAALLLAGPAVAQVDSREGIALQNQIYQLRQQLQAVQDQVARGGGGSGNRQPSYSPPPSQSGGSDLLAQLLTRVDSLEDQVRQLRGRIDETQNQLQRQNDDLGKRIDDLAFQISPQNGGPPNLGPRGPSAPLSSPGPGPAPMSLAAPPLPRPPSPTGPRPPELALQEGNAALTRRDYSAAEAAAREVLANRTSPRAYDAQFLLAQALAGERQYPQAAVAYDDVYNRARSGAHAQDARLGLASSLTAINEKKAACDVLGRMGTEFPHLRPDISAGMAATAQKAGCR
jgi:TolA-binding protein